MPWSKLKTDEVIVRRTKLLALRREGVRFDDERVEALGYTSPNAARKDVTRALKAHYDDEAAEVGIYRQQENERLDDELKRLAAAETAVHRVLENRHIIVNNGRVVLDPDTNQPMDDDAIVLQAIDRLVKIEDARRRNGERRAKLNGLDAPEKTEVSGPDGGAVPLGSGSLAELNNLITIAGGPAETDGGEATGEDSST
ncbi:hypothetical protein [Streptomyces sp. NEAU-H3]|uniref:hypothetical protein n=1 Tax=Streptomyces sp. NEAU-H3 TaxID=2720636 RepID=UPI0014393A74|nr:hypothetical protein [Streptomyces sp. NEAU-H3]NJA59177.1 hypothetical protein [Streptomyces sp. NEAU-H3]